MTVNNDMLDLANDIKAIKETVRQAIENKGVSCDTSVPFNKYPNKISQVAQDVLWVKNELGSDPESDKKVWITPINYSGADYYTFLTTDSLTTYLYASLCPIIGYEALFSAQDTTYKNQLFSLDKDTGNKTWIPSTSFSSNSLSQRPSNYPLSGMFSPYLYFVRNYYNTYQSNYNRGNNILLYSLYNENIKVQQTSRYLFYNYAVDQSSPWALHKYDPITGVIDVSSSYGTFTEDPVPSNEASRSWTIINSTGKILVRSAYNSSYSDYMILSRYVYNEDTGQFDKTLAWRAGSSVITLRAICLGYTSDNKYVILGSMQNFTAWICRWDDGTTWSQYTELDPINYCYWNNNTQTLLTVKENVIHMYKYTPEAGFVEYSLDFGDIIPNNDLPSMNYDETLISFTDSNNYRRVMSLEYQGDLKYKALPFQSKNFVTSAFTGILTGNKNDENNSVEVFTTIPPEYKVEATVETEDDNVEIIAES